MSNLSETLIGIARAGMTRSPKVVTENIYPPIPIRQFDWTAHYDDPEGPCGYGATEAEAIADLLENHPRDEHR
jgi:hypothetical protein